jgi:type I restriction enzyme S subunit
MRRYEKYKDSGIEWIGEIPEQWFLQKCKYLFKEHTGNGFPEDMQGESSGNIPFYKVSDLNGLGIYVNESNNYVSFEDIEIKKWNIIPKGSILTAKIGEALRKNHRKICLGDCIVDNNCLGLEPKGVDYKYAFYLLKIVDFDWFVNPGAVPSVSMDKLRSFFIPITTNPDEQIAIANYLDQKTAEIDELIKQKEELLLLFEEEKAAIINHAVTKGINSNVKLKESGIDWLGLIPAHWEIKKLKYVADANPSNIDKKSKDDELEVFLCNYIDVYKNDFITSEIDFMKATASESQIEKFILRKGDVIATKDSETPDDIGNPALVLEDFENVVCGYHLTHIKPYKINGEYLFRYFKSKFLKSYFEVSANGITRYGLGVDKFNASPILIPPFEEQQIITDFINQEIKIIDSKVELAQNLIEQLKEYKTALISEVATGKVKVI